VDKEPHFLPRDFDINPQFTLEGKLSLTASLCAWSPNKWHLMNRFVAINCSSDVEDHWLQDGEANIKLFHIVRNGRHVKKFIPSIRNNGEEIITECA
jgi:hypothetical protein